MSEKLSPGTLAEFNMKLRATIMGMGYLISIVKSGKALTAVIASIHSNEKLTISGSSLHQLNLGLKNFIDQKRGV